MSEMVKYVFPQLIDLHNYSASNSYAQKMYNWNTLNEKVFRKKIGFELSKSEIEGIVCCKRWAIENVLIKIEQRFEQYAKILESKRKNRENKKIRKQSKV